MTTTGSPPPPRATSNFQPRAARFSRHLDDHALEKRLSSVPIDLVRHSRCSCFCYAHPAAASRTGLTTSSSYKTCGLQASPSFPHLHTEPGLGVGYSCDPLLLVGSSWRPSFLATFLHRPPSPSSFYSSHHDAFLRLDESHSPTAHQGPSISFARVGRYCLAGSIHARPLKQQATSDRPVNTLQSPHDLAMAAPCQ